MAVTHADLEIGPSYRSLGSKWGTTVMVICTVLGLAAFVLSLVAETVRSEVLWVIERPSRSEPESVDCFYIGSGKVPTLCASGALSALVMALALGQTYLGIALCNPAPTEKARPLYAWASNSNTASSLRWKAALFYVSLWISFAVAAVLLLIGIAVEANRLQAGNNLHQKCLVVRQGLFAAAGVFALSCTSLGAAFYITALQTYRVEAAEADVRQEVLEVTMLSSATTLWINQQEDAAQPLSLHREGPNPSSAAEVPLDCSDTMKASLISSFIMNSGLNLSKSSA